MAIASRSTPGRFSRIVSAIASRERVITPTAAGLVYSDEDMLGQRRGTAAGRRANRSSHDIAALNAAVFGAIRWREQAISKPPIVLEQKRGGEWMEIGRVDEPGIHPALDALRRVNGGITGSQGRMGIERGKLTNSSHIWVKRRSVVTGDVLEFEVWDTSTVRVFPKKEEWWLPDRFERQNPDGSRTIVDPEDVIYFRHIIDPKNPLWALTPISAIRMETDTAFEAMRHNLRYFDNGIPVGQVLVPESGDDEVDPVEIQRMLDKIKTEWVGTDQAHTWHIMERALKPLITPATMHDMQFAEQLMWGVEQAGRAFELSPITMKDFRHATYSNADQAAQQDWDMIRTQLDSTLDELNEWLIIPDFGEDVRLVADYADISALQDDEKQSAEIDEINLRSNKVTINELRARDGLDAVPWGDVPLVASNIIPLGSAPPAAPSPPPQQQEPAPNPPPDADTPADGERSRAVEQTPSTEGEPAVLARERALATAWRRRLTDELRYVLDRFAEMAEGTRAIDDIDIEALNWDWIDRYGDEVIRELTSVHVAVLTEREFIETPLLTATDLARRYAEERAGELLSLEGPISVTRTTREGVRRLVGRAIDEGWGIRQLRNALRDSFEFSTSRAETIARTETATSQGQGAEQAARIQGRDQKRWRTARDERVDGGNASGPCIEAAGAGWIDIADDFPNGRSTIPAHPRCRCDVEYRSSALQ